MKEKDERGSREFARQFEFAEEFFLKYDLKGILEKVFPVIKEQMGKRPVSSYMHEPREVPLTYNLFDRAVSNHLLDDKPEFFGIAKIEGHKIRAFVQQYIDPTNNPAAKQVIEKYFSDVFEEE